MNVKRIEWRGQTGYVPGIGRAVHGEQYPLQADYAGLLIEQGLAVPVEVVEEPTKSAAPPKAAAPFRRKSSQQVEG